MWNPPNDIALLRADLQEGRFLSYDGRLLETFDAFYTPPDKINASKLLLQHSSFFCTKNLLARFSSVQWAQACFDLQVFPKESYHWHLKHLIILSYFFVQILLIVFFSLFFVKKEWIYISTSFCANLKFYWKMQYVNSYVLSSFSCFLLNFFYLLSSSNFAITILIRLTIFR